MASVEEKVKAVLFDSQKGSYKCKNIYDLLSAYHGPHTVLALHLHYLI